MSVCRSFRLCDLPERQGCVKQRTTVLSCSLADTAVSSSNLISFPRHGLTLRSPWTCPPRASSLIPAEIRTQLFIFLWIVALCRDWVEIDLCRHFNSKGTIFYSKQLWRLNEEVSLFFFFFPLSHHHHSWFLGSSEITTGPRTEPWGTPQM